MKKWIPTLMTVSTILVATFAPQGQALIAHHPVLTTFLTGLWAILNHFAPSPIDALNKH
jgi:hypothetical protein